MRRQNLDDEADATPQESIDHVKQIRYPFDKSMADDLALLEAINTDQKQDSQSQEDWLEHPNLSGMLMAYSYM